MNSDKTDQWALAANNLGKQVSNGQTTLTILAGIDLAVAAGESLSIVGTSGAGKSTLLALLAGLDTPTSGQIQLLGADLHTLDEDQRAQLRSGQVGFVFQSFQLLSGMTALENVMLGLELAGRGNARETAAQALQQVGLGKRLAHTPRQLSGGEQQRVALARAFAIAPRILFADEPTGNLDDSTSGQITDLLFRLNAEQKTTLILVTHDRELAAHCQRRLTLREASLYDDPPARTGLK